MGKMPLSYYVKRTISLLLDPQSVGMLNEYNHSEIAELLKEQQRLIDYLHACNRKCSLIARLEYSPDIIEGKCVGFQSSTFNDEPCEQCKQCFDCYFYE